MKTGIKIGRPKVTDRPDFNSSFEDILERLTHNQISRRQAAIELKIGYATLKRLIDYRDNGKTMDSQMIIKAKIIALKR